VDSARTPSWLLEKLLRKQLKGSRKKMIKIQAIKTHWKNLKNKILGKIKKSDKN